MFALLDCNNFFVSCERVFDPSITKKPVAVLSNNDGCIIARSNEVKALGVPMGAPLYKYKDIIKSNNVRLFSCNFELYGDFSNRVMSIIRSVFDDVEMYSIDEAFIKFDDPDEFYKKCVELKNKIKEWVGIPTSIGIANSKVLAKLANSIAKKTNEVVILKGEVQINEVLKKTKLTDLWGVNYKTGIRLQLIGINNAYAFKKAPQKLVRKELGVIGEKILMELNGVDCFKIENSKSKKSIQSTRSFGKPILKIEELEQAIANYTSKACYKLRKQNSKTSMIYVYIRTNRFSKFRPQYSNGMTIGFSPTSYTPDIIKRAIECIRMLYKEGFEYKKAGIILMEITDVINEQIDLFEDRSSSEMKSKLIQSIDKINNKYKFNKVYFASQGIKKEWSMKSDMRSPKYTTKWSDIPLVN